MNGKKIFAVAIVGIMMLAMSAMVMPASAGLSPRLQAIEDNYVDTSGTYADKTGICLKLKEPAGIDYGYTWEGAYNLALYAVTIYYQKTGEVFPRSIDGNWEDSVESEIWFHCRLWKYCPPLRGRANPVNIGLDDSFPWI